MAKRSAGNTLALVGLSIVVVLILIWGGSVLMHISMTGNYGGGAAPDFDLVSRVASETAAQTVRAMQSAGGGGAWAANAALAGTVVAFAGLSGIRRA